METHSLAAILSLTKPLLHLNQQPQDLTQGSDFTGSVMDQSDMGCGSTDPCQGRSLLLFSYSPPQSIKHLSNTLGLFGGKDSNLVTGYPADESHESF